MSFEIIFWVHSPSLAKDMFYVYILKSAKDHKLYVGYTDNLKRRFIEHNKGQEASTKWRVPFHLVYYEAYISPQDAKRREKMLKNFSGAYTHLKKRIEDSIIFCK